MNKIVLALAMVATLGLRTAAFADNPTSSIKERAQAVQSHAAVSRERRRKRAPNAMFTKK